MLQCSSCYNSVVRIPDTKLLEVKRFTQDYIKLHLSRISQRWTELSREMQTQIQFYMHLLRKNPIGKEVAVVLSFYSGLKYSYLLLSSSFPEEKR